jgi:hypothetical protein
MLKYELNFLNMVLKILYLGYQTARDVTFQCSLVPGVSNLDFRTTICQSIMVTRKGTGKISRATSCRLLFHTSWWGYANLIQVGHTCFLQFVCIIPVSVDLILMSRINLALSKQQAITYCPYNLSLGCVVSHYFKGTQVRWAVNGFNVWRG